MDISRQSAVQIFYIVSGYLMAMILTRSTPTRRTATEFFTRTALSKSRAVFRRSPLHRSRLPVFKGSHWQRDISELLVRRGRQHDARDVGLRPCSPTFSLSGKNGAICWSTEPDRFSLICKPSNIRQQLHSSA
jgi:hypothetical protein